MAKPAYSALEVLQRLDVFLLPKIRPHFVTEVELGVGGLPEQEVAEPQLTACSDEQVGAGELSQNVRGEVAGEHRLVDVIRVEQLVLHLAGELPARPHDVPPPAVAGR